MVEGRARLAGGFAAILLTGGCGSAGPGDSTPSSTPSSPGGDASSSSTGSATSTAEEGIAIGSPEAEKLAKKYLLSPSDVKKLGVKSTVETGLLAGGAWWSTCTQGLDNDADIRQRGQTVWDERGVKAFHAVVVYSTAKAAKTAAAEAKKVLDSCTTYEADGVSYSDVSPERMKDLTGVEDEARWCQKAKAKSAYALCNGFVVKDNIVSYVWASSEERAAAARAAGLVLGVATVKLRR